MKIHVEFNQNESDLIDNIALKAAMLVNPKISAVDAAGKIYGLKQEGFKSLDPNYNTSLTHENGYNMNIQFSSAAGEAVINVVDKVIDVVTPLFNLLKGLVTDITNIMEDATIEFREIGYFDGRPVVFIEDRKHYLEEEMLKPFVENHTLFLVGQNTNTTPFINVGIDDYLRVDDLDAAVDEYNDMIQAKYEATDDAIEEECEVEDEELI